MTILQTIPGDLLQSDVHFIAQQTNCLTVRCHGLSLAIANRFPTHGNHYARRRPVRHGNNTACVDDRSVPGTVDISEHKGEPSMIFMHCQWSPGDPMGKWPKYYPKCPFGRYETTQDREFWFQQALDQLDQRIPTGQYVGVPANIGCGLAGGNWTTYKSMLEQASTLFVVYDLGA
jgi:hypothetical protein